MFVDCGRFALKVSFSPAIFCWLNTQFAHLVFPPPRPQPGLFQELEGGAVPGTHWNWNKEQPLESLHSAAHRLLYRCPVFGGHETLVFIFIFFSCFAFFFSPVKSQTCGYRPSSAFLSITLSSTLKPLCSSESKTSSNSKL